MSGMTLSREAAREAVDVNSAADAASLTPQEARDALNAKYSAIMGATETRPSRIHLIEYVIDPFLAAIPDIVAGHEDDENSRRLLAEIMAICVAMRMDDRAVMKLTSTYDPYVVMKLTNTYDPYVAPVDDEEVEHPEPVIVTLPVSGAKISVGKTFLDRIRSLARRGGVWLMLADSDLVAELEAENPIGVLNAIAEIQQYAAAVTFKVKLDSQQLKMLQAFFRSA